MNKNKNILIPVAVILVLAFAGGIGFLAGKRAADSAPQAQNQTEERADPSDLEADDETWQGTVVYNGREYVENHDIKTVLFLGIDNTPAQGDIIGKGGRSDAIALLILDKSAKTAQILEISRDTMMDIDVYDNYGDFSYIAHMQLCMQYAFGDSPRRSCYLTKKKVSELFYGQKIDYCSSLTMDGISAITDDIGGVTLTMPEDYTDVNPSYCKGAQVTMNGAEVEHFVRTRDHESGGNTRRMDRQNWFLLEFARQLKNQSRVSVFDLFDLAKPYLETDIDDDALSMLRDYSLINDSLKVPGQSKMGDLHDEFYVDDDALKELVIQLFYVPKS